MNKQMQNKNGISLIVLVVTIIVMVILAGAIVLTLNNSEIINKTQDAVKQTNEATVKEVADLGWAEAYADGARTEEELRAGVLSAFEKNKINIDDYIIIVTEKGVDVFFDDGVVPVGAVYTAANGKVYNVGDKMPEKITVGDVYTYGNYKYMYSRNYGGGWTVGVLDSTKSEYGEILSEINGVAVIEIRDNGFKKCTGLTSITIPNSVKTIGRSAFYECTSLTNITIPNSVKTIRSWAFYECTSLTNITIPNSVQNIEEGVFSHCTSLKNITIQGDVESIGKEAFGNCANLTSIHIPASVTSIENDAFVGTNLDITFDSAFDINSKDISDRAFALGKTNSYSENKFFSTYGDGTTTEKIVEGCGVTYYYQQTNVTINGKTRVMTWYTSKTESNSKLC